MPFATRDGCRLYWKLDGQADKPPLLLLNSIGTDMSLWDRTLPYLLPSFRLLRMDTRGHGASDVPQESYSLQQLALDARAVLDAAGLDKVAVAGVSLGGMIAMELALTAPERVSALALICTSAEMDAAVWAARIAQVQTGGMAAIADVVLGRFLSPGFAAANPSVEQSLRRCLVDMASAGYVGCGAAIRDMVLTDRLQAIGAPTLVIAGSHDISTPFEGHGARIARSIPDAQVAHLDCAHLPPIEAPAALATTLHRFLLREPKVAQAEDLLFEAGLMNRRRILGDAWVDRALDERNEFNHDFQAMITRIVWHEVWGRPGLEERTRRLLVLAITAALGRWEEFRLHIQAGLEQGGFTKDELSETLLQLAVYAGVPTANTAFREATAVFSSLEQKDKA